MENSRRTRRVELAGILDGAVTVLHPAHVTELGIDGMRIETTVPLPLNSLHDFRFDLDGQTIVVRGRVVHERVSDVERDAVRYLSGIEFVEPSQHVTAAIEGFIDRLLRHRRALAQDGGTGGGVDQ